MDINLVWDPARGVNFQEYEGDKATAAKAAADNEKATARHVSNAGVHSNPDADLGEAERQAAEEAKEKAAVMSFRIHMSFQLIDRILGAQVAATSGLETHPMGRVSPHRENAMTYTFLSCVSSTSLLFSTARTSATQRSRA